MVEDTRKNIRHKVRRELIAGTLNVYPIKDHAVIGEGEHRFGQLDRGKCESVPMFLMLWEHANGRWWMTRLLGYGHRLLRPDDRRASARAASRKRAGLAKVSRRWRR